MKTFQLKIMIKNSHPPIWRRVIVPSGITFTQLSMILNKVMGWSGYHAFQFEFYHLQLLVMEDIRYTAIPCAGWDHLEASTTYVREFLEQNKWFTYIYDLGDFWEHRVTVEEIAEGDTSAYPQVIKYKGECPGEDGGICGKFDLEEINEDLARMFFYKWGKGEKRMQAELYRDHYAGNYGLNAALKDKNKSEKMLQSEQHKMDETFKKIAALIKEKEMLENKLQEKMKRTTLADIFRDYSKADLVDIARVKGLKKAAACKKEELIQKLTAHMCKPEVMEAYFLCMQDDEITVLEKAIKKQGLYTEEDSVLLSGLYEAAYIGMMENDNVLIPQEVAQQYQAFSGETFTQKRKTRSFIVSCLKAACLLYGIAPIDRIWKMAGVNPEFSLTPDELREEIDAIPGDISPVVMVNDCVYKTEFFPDDRGLLKAQEDKEFYIPTLKELTDLGSMDNLPDSSQLKRLKYFMTTRMGVKGDVAEHAGLLIQTSICSGCKMQEVSDILEYFGITAANRKQAEELIMLLKDLWNNTRMVVNRGFTPNELAQHQNAAQNVMASGGQEQPAKIVSFQAAKKAKVYPNDPCPCGSGKKYKNCCRNKE